MSHIWWAPWSSLKCDVQGYHTWTVEILSLFLTSTSARNPHPSLTLPLLSAHLLVVKTWVCIDLCRWLGFSVHSRGFVGVESVICAPHWTLEYVTDPHQTPSNPRTRATWFVLQRICRWVSKAICRVPRKQTSQRPRTIMSQVNLSFLVSCSNTNLLGFHVVWYISPCEAMSMALLRVDCLRLACLLTCYNLLAWLLAAFRTLGIFQPICLIAVGLFAYLFACLLVKSTLSCAYQSRF